MFGHQSIYDAALGPTATDGWRVLIMRRWPRGIRRARTDQWLRDAAPSEPLRHAYVRGDLPWPEFEARYRAELTTERPAVLDELLALEREHGLVTLQCTERLPPAEHCHRTVLIELLAARAAAREREASPGSP
jgi:uncharacterized protein YeaO (DUF488 family)